jgi:bile acid-coenzyme A ligase
MGKGEGRALTVEEPPPISLGSRLTQLAATRPGECGLLFAWSSGEVEEFPWEVLERRALQVAGLLQERGVEAGMLVGVGLPSCPEHFFVSFAALKLGACPLPLRADLPAWERDRLLEVAKPALVVSNWEDLADPHLSLDEIRATEGAAARALPDRVPSPSRAIASSGSTGRPKIIISRLPGEGVPVEEGGPYTELVPAPLYHTNGFSLSHFSLFNGNRVIVMERFDAARVVDLIERCQVNHVTMVPTMLRRVARLPDIRERDFSSIQSVRQGGAPCPDWLVRTWIDLVGGDSFFMSYGATEAVGLVQITGTEWLERPGSVGKGVNSEVRILDDEGKALPPGEVGEIYMRMEGAVHPTFEYLGAPPAKRTADDMASVGDLGWLDAEGYLFVADRRTDMIVSGGANVFPAEVESAVSEHPSVEDVVVVGVPDEEWGQRVTAVIQPRPGAEVVAEELEAHCRERLAPYKVPKGFEVMDRLPRLESGKLNRTALAAQLRAGRK